MGVTKGREVKLGAGQEQQPGGPLAVVRDNLNTHVSVAMAELIAARDWLFLDHAVDLSPPWHPINHAILKPDACRAANLRHDESALADD